MHQVRDRFGIGVGRELVAQQLKRVAHVAVVLDDAVVHHAHAAADVRVRVALGRRAVRGPARMADADGALELLLPGQLLQLGDAAARAQALERAVDDRYPGRVVAAVLEAQQPLDQDRDDVARAYRGDDAAHGLTLRMTKRSRRLASKATHSSRPIAAQARVCQTLLAAPVKSYGRLRMAQTCASTAS